MQILKRVKHELKKNDSWNKYKNKYAHKQMLLLPTKVASIYKNDLTLQEALNLEAAYMNAKKEDKDAMFQKLAPLFRKVLKAKWESFCKFLWYVFQTSTYWKDSKKGIENIFNKDNYILINKAKRNLYFEWVKSIDEKLEKYNGKLTHILKAVY